MVLPLLAAAALRVGAGAAVRAGATRVLGAEAANSVRGRVLSQAAGHYGVNALQRGVQNRQQVQRKPDGGFTNWVRENPGEAVTGYALSMARAGTFSDGATAATNSLLQSTQFQR